LLVPLPINGLESEVTLELPNRTEWSLSRLKIFTVTRRPPILLVQATLKPIVQLGRLSNLYLEVTFAIGDGGMEATNTTFLPEANDSK
jgi:hypothetical protein